MAEKKFKYDPEAGLEQDNSRIKMLRLPFALCKEYGIAIQDWWRPHDAWVALENNGYVQDVDEEYKNYIRELKKKEAKQARELRKLHDKQVEAQEQNPEHIVDKDYQHKDGAIAGAVKGKPMTFDEADSGSVNPYIKSQWVDGHYVEYIGYHHNCQTCVATYIARRKGYDVRALPNLNNKNIYDLSYNTSLAYVDKNGKHPEREVKPHGMKTSVWLRNKPNGIYSVEFSYTGKRSGHIITAEKTDNGVMFYDPQIDKKMEDLREYGSISNIKLMNLTNVDLDESFCDKIMKPVKKAAGV